MVDGLPWRPIAIILGGILLVVIAFRAPYDGTAATVRPSGPVTDAAGVGVTQPGALATPEPQPGVTIPQPTQGSKPIQLVVVSVDGGCETADGTIQKLMDTGQPFNARFTFFVSGLCLVPDAARTAYHPPGRAAGVSDIPFANPDLVAPRIRVFTDMYRRGHEIGTHFLGHFCGSGGVDSWSAADWTSEIDQSKSFLDFWPQNNPQVSGLDPLPFNSSVIKGDRTPCLEGARKEMWPAFTAAGFRYDASDPGVLQWPRTVGDGKLWEFPLPALKLAGTDKWVLSMDYNLLVNQTGGKTDVPPDQCKQVEDQTYQTYMDALEGVYNGNRAPLILGSHLNDWACNAYINALERFITDAHARHPDIMMVSFQDLADYLEGMDPGERAALQALPPQRY